MHGILGYAWVCPLRGRILKPLCRAVCVPQKLEARKLAVQDAQRWTTIATERRRLARELYLLDAARQQGPSIVEVSHAMHAYPVIRMHCVLV